MRSSINQSVPLPKQGEFAPLILGERRIDPPVVLAPMAGVTNAPFRSLCRRFSRQRCLYVSEMITAQSFVMGHAKTRLLASFGQDEEFKSIQLYGTKPEALAAAAKILVGEWGVDHIDINLGCPARKVTAAGGGSAIPVRPKLMARLLRAVVTNAGKVPVTVKFRTGIDESLLTYRDAGRVAQEEGCAAVAMHARSAAQLYNGDADWSRIADLKSRMSIPVLGNGDIFEAFDALRMMRETGADGVVIGRACLGRPWLFRDLVDTFAGQEPEDPPLLGEVVAVALEHAELLVDFFGERTAMLHMRKFGGWYLKSFPHAKRLMPDIHRVGSLKALRELLSQMPPDAPYPEAALRVRRGKTGRTQTVSLPQGYLEDRELDEAPEAAENSYIEGG